VIGLLLAGLLRAPRPATAPEEPPLADDIICELRHGEGHHQPDA
jgi:hypothetical protein